jgi:hypothetical protein
MGRGGGERGFGAGRIPRLPPVRHLSRGNGSGQEKRDHRGKTGIGTLPQRARRALGEKAVGPCPPSGMWRSNLAPVRFSPDIPDAGRPPSVALTRGAGRFPRGIRSGPVRPVDSHPRKSSGCCAGIRSPDRQAFVGSLNHPCWDDITSESIVSSAPPGGRSISAGVLERAVTRSQ